MRVGKRKPCDCCKWEAWIYTLLPPIWMMDSHKHFGFCQTDFLSFWSYMMTSLGRDYLISHLCTLQNNILGGTPHLKLGAWQGNICICSLFSCGKLHGISNGTVRVWGKHLPSVDRSSASLHFTLVLSHYTQNLGRNQTPHVACLIQGTMFLYSCAGLKKCDTGSHLLTTEYKLHTFNK